MSRRFTSASSERIAIGGGQVAQTLSGVVLAAIVNVTTGAATQVIFGFGTGSNPFMRWGINTSNIPFFDVNGAPRTATSALTSGWYCLILTKATGSATGRIHTYRYDTNVWVHQNLSALSSDPAITGTSGLLGAYNTTTPANFWNADIAVAAVYETNYTTDNAVESLGLQFSLQAWFAPPNIRGMWLLDQQSTSQIVSDVTGQGSDQTAITGTSVSTASVPVFSYGHGGGISIT